MSNLKLEALVREFSYNGVRIPIQGRTSPSTRFATC